MDREARITVETRVTDTATTHWVLQAQQNYDAAALRLKRRGKWRTWSWQEIGPVVEEVKSRQSVAENTSKMDSGWLPIALTDRDEVLLLGNRSWRDTPQAVARAWTEKGFVLALAEADGDELADLHEHRPHVVVGRSAFFEGWYADVADAIGRQRGFRHRLLAPLLSQQAKPPGILRRLVRWRLKASLGLGRARALWIIDETLSAAAVGFFRALDVVPVFVVAQDSNDEDPTPVLHASAPRSRTLSA